MVVQDKKTREIRIYVDLKKLNVVCLHDPLPSDPDCQGISPQDHICNRMGILLVYNDAIWLEECTNHIFQGGGRSV
jgi:hypothetical protein